MSKGRPATRGIEDAIRIARKRGCVMKIFSGFESTCDFLIRTVSFIVFVKARRTEKILSTPAAVEYECQDLIGQLRLFPPSAQIVLELWIYSKHGTYRFFHLGEHGLTELDREGIPVPAPRDEPPPGTGSPSGIWGKGVLVPE